MEGLQLNNSKTNRHMFNQHVVRVTKRDELQSYLKRKGVGTELYYPVPLHLQECFAYLGHDAGAFPESERTARETLASPIHPELMEPQAHFVAQCVREVLKREQLAVAMVKSAFVAAHF